MPRNWKDKLKTGVLWVLPTLNAFYEAAVVAMAITDRANDDDYSVGLRFLLLSSATGFAFIQSMALNGHATVEGVKESYDIITTRQYPDNDDWPLLPKGKEIFCLTTTGLITLAVLNADFFSGYFFVDEVPDDYEFAENIDLRGWKAFAIVTGIIAASTTAFTECISLLKILRQYFSGRRQEYENSFSKYSTIILGNTIAFLGGAENAIEAWASMKKILHPNTDAEKYSLFTSCSSKLFSDYNFSGKNCRDGIKAFTERLSRGNIRTTEVIAFTFTAGTAVLVVFAQPALTADLINSEKTSPPYHSPSAVTSILGWGVTTRDGIVQIYKLYPFIHSKVELGSLRLQNLFQRIKNYLCGETDLLPLRQPLMIEQESKSISPYSERNSSVMFSPRRSVSAPASVAEANYQTSVDFKV